MLSLQNIQVAYGPAKALWDVSLNVGQGELSV
jgi:ABC-type branched-subunit amino acid transport system ATPase component